MNALDRELEEVLSKSPMDWENILRLISEGADPNLQDYCESTPLHYASSDGENRVIQFLLNDDRTNPNTKNCKDMTPLGYAVLYRNNETVRIFLQDPRTDPNSKNGMKQNTPLMLAIKEAGKTYNDRMIKTLLADQRLDINRENKDGQTALVLAYDLGFSHKKILELLLNDPRIDITKGTEYELEEIEAMYPEYFKLLRLQRKLKKIYNNYKGLKLASRNDILLHLFKTFRELGQHVDLNDSEMIQDRIEAIQLLLPKLNNIILEFALGK